MSPQLTPATGHQDSSFPPSRTGSHRLPTTELLCDLGVRPGESDPARMLAGVLLLVAATLIMALALLWWLS
ncbi:MAG: hypothetical protein JO115_18450 [Pseudonocardiales bacterium]|nr:hypothetical protein [Pseudonocardiales bacterium]